MSVDYIRVYQRKDSINIGCDPKNFPTSSYIETSVIVLLKPSIYNLNQFCSYKAAYTNPNMSTWKQTGQAWPKNRLQNGGNC